MLGSGKESVDRIRLMGPVINACQGYYKLHYGVMFTRV